MSLERRPVTEQLNRRTAAIVGCVVAATSMTSANLPAELVLVSAAVTYGAIGYASPRPARLHQPSHLLDTHPARHGHPLDRTATLPPRPDSYPRQMRTRGPAPSHPC